jgi:hypothetical protein
MLHVQLYLSILFIYLHVSYLYTLQRIQIIQRLAE